MSVEKAECGNCQFYYCPGDPPLETGWCRRYPPQLISSDSDAGFPEMEDRDWCGEWKEKQE